MLPLKIQTKVKMFIFMNSIQNRTSDPSQHTQKIYIYIRHMGQKGKCKTPFLCRSHHCVYRKSQVIYETPTRN